MKNVMKSYICRTLVSALTKTRPPSRQAHFDCAARRTAAVAKPSRSVSESGGVKSNGARRNIVAAAAGLRHSRGPVPESLTVPIIYAWESILFALLFLTATAHAKLTVIATTPDLGAIAREI